MKRISLLLAIIVFSFTAFAQEKDSTQRFSLNTEATLASRNVWRGLDYGSSPSLQGTLSVRRSFYEVGAWGTTTLNGSKEGYGTWMELFATAYYKSFSFTIDDYFFFNAADSLNNYFDWGRTKTQHFIEGRVKYTHDRFSLMAGYALYKNKADKTNGVYLEAEYFFREDFSFIVGGVTSGTWLSFYDRGGVTTIGFSGKRNLIVTKDFSTLLKASIIANPNYKGSVNAEGVGTNPIYFVVYLTF